ncbi:MAG TPA: cytochrome c [Gemmatimonadales bacterium]|nr:cytochrome c [Gemmatimonadales bacterium]
MLLARGIVALGLVLLPLGAVAGQGPASVSSQVYAGWRQYSVHCARCHGQDVLGNPVAANLLETTAPGGAVAEEEPFTTVVLEGRPDRGMPGFKDQMTPEQVAAVYAYVRGRAAREIPPGRPKREEG